MKRQFPTRKDVVYVGVHRTNGTMHVEQNGRVHRIWKGNLETTKARMVYAIAREADFHLFKKGHGVQLAGPKILRQKRLHTQGFAVIDELSQGLTEVDDSFSWCSYSQGKQWSTNEHDESAPDGLGP